MKNASMAVTLTTLALGLALPAAAHHSYAMFNKELKVSNDAVVRIWEFTNPHATLWVYIDDTQGKPQLWGLEAPGPSELMRNGWDRSTVKPGDKINVTINPLKDGKNGGSLVSVTLADGRTLTVGGGPRP